MEVSQALLVAMMFVTVLSLGIGNILTGLSTFVDRRTEADRHWLQMNWLLLLLLQHLNLFWNTLLIISVQAWTFAEFLYVVTGPVLLFFATSLMLPKSERVGTDDVSSHYFNVARRFFTLLAVLMVWSIGVDVVLGEGLTANNGWDAVGLVLFVMLASLQQRRLHTVATGVAWAIFLSLTLFKALA